MHNENESPDTLQVTISPQLAKDITVVAKPSIMHRHYNTLRALREAKMHIFTYLLILDKVQVLSVYLKARINLTDKLFYHRLHTDSLFPQNRKKNKNKKTAV